MRLSLLVRSRAHGLTVQAVAKPHTTEGLIDRVYNLTQEPEWSYQSDFCGGLSAIWHSPELWGEGQRPLGEPDRGLEPTSDGFPENYASQRACRERDVLPALRWTSPQGLGGSARAPS